MEEIRFASHPTDVKNYTTDELVSHFLIPELLVSGEINIVYSMYDRFITMGAKPIDTELQLPAFEAYTKANYFLERREMGVINVGGDGIVSVDGQQFTMAPLECLYIGKGSKEVTFKSTEATAPAEFYINSTPAHHAYPTTLAKKQDANRVELGSKDSCNERTILQFIHEEGIQSCQLVMGYTELKKGSIWNTFPPHTHHRRMEVYFYFNLPEDQVVMHLMGEPNETRHIVMRDKQAVISPEWSIHSGAGTSAYTFIWGMGGENQAFTDMDAVVMKSFR